MQSPRFLLYGATGFVGEQIARMALRAGMQPVLAGRDRRRISALADELELEHRVARLNDPGALEAALDGLSLVLHCAGPFLATYRSMVEACLSHHVHYLDLTGEIPVFQDLAALDAQAKDRRVMLLPGAGFDVAATDCLARHLKQRLPSASNLRLAFRSNGPAGVPPGTARTSIELVPGGLLVRRDGRLTQAPDGQLTREVDFGDGPVTVYRLTWGDVFTAYHSTGIGNISDYAALPPASVRQLRFALRLRPLFRLSPVRALAKMMISSGSTPAERERTHTDVWGEVTDRSGNRAVSRLHGPEAGVIWTALAALAAVRRTVMGEAPPGFQTPATAFGADFVLDCEGVRRVDVV